jgi:hypothetical protein
MLALSQIPLFDRKTIPPSRPAVPGARRRVAVKEGRLAIAKRREASLRATCRLATLGEGGRSTIGVMPNPEWTQGPQAARLNQRLSTELKFRSRLYQSR